MRRAILARSAREVGERVAVRRHFEAGLRIRICVCCRIVEPSTLDPWLCGGDYVCWQFWLRPGHECMASGSTRFVWSPTCLSQRERGFWARNLAIKDEWG